MQSQLIKRSSLTLSMGNGEFYQMLHAGEKFSPPHRLINRCSPSATLQFAVNSSNENRSQKKSSPKAWKSVKFGISNAFKLTNCSKHFRSWAVSSETHSTTGYRIARQNFTNKTRQNALLSGDRENFQIFQIVKRSKMKRSTAAVFKLAEQIASKLKADHGKRGLHLSLECGAVAIVIGRRTWRTNTIQGASNYAKWKTPRTTVKHQFSNGSVQAEQNEPTNVRFQQLIVLRVQKCLCTINVFHLE
ncbi:hypothetical protein T11_883 [Trichinella zimbabwensis]|uniref:Uncharacterized protein n=1 Tax=Trichinella zimbabwensis TaxID=268475 RepID=A0A0V1HEA1_9BILA|nr:hypothetical protein T11_883 [Trichinella zimbabwensis]